MEKDVADDEKDKLWVGFTKFERRRTPCEYAAGLLIAPDLLAREYKGDVIVFPDLSQHVLFKDHALVTEAPHGKKNNTPIAFLLQHHRIVENSQVLRHRARK